MTLRCRFFSFAYLLVVLSSTAFANDSELTLINHFTHPLTLEVSIHPETLPGLHDKLTLPPSQQIKTAVLDNQTQAYVRVKDNESQANFAYFGVKIENNKAVVHGYLGSGIAYSWANEVVTFCTPDEYKSKHSC